MRITVAGTGYVGLSLAALFAQRHEVKALDILQDRVDLINSGKSPIREPYLEALLANGKLSLSATTDKELAYKDAELIVVATPTNYNEETQFFDTSSIDDVVINAINYCPDTPIVVKSTVPIGFTECMRQKYNKQNIYFSPEFLREGQSVYDNLHPSRIIVGDKGEVGKLFANLLREASLDEDTEVLLMKPTEAEAVKLFSNTYLAMRVAYFNELDTYARAMKLNAADIISGVSLDKRIGKGFNNPSFGYGGYCFPKDSKQMVANYKASGINESLMTATVKSNELRKKFIASDICKNYPVGKIGIYKTAMKANSDNNRSSSILDVIKYIKLLGREVEIYEPNYDMSYLCKQVDTLDELVKDCTVIVANRADEQLEATKCIIYTADISGEDK